MGDLEDSGKVYIRPGVEIPLLNEQESLVVNVVGALLRAQLAARPDETLSTHKRFALSYAVAAMLHITASSDEFFDSGRSTSVAAALQDIICDHTQPVGEHAPGSPYEDALYHQFGHTIARSLPAANKPAMELLLRLVDYALLAGPVADE